MTPRWSSKLDMAIRGMYDRVYRLLESRGRKPYFGPVIQQAELLCEG